VTAVDTSTTGRTLDLTWGLTARSFIEAAATGRMADGRQVEETAAIAPRSEGKFLPACTPILTPSGWIKAGDVQVGETLLSVDGHPTTVLGVYPQPSQACWSLTFSDSTSIVSSEDHLWAVDTTWDRDPRARPRTTRKVVTTREIVAHLQAGHWRRGGRWSIPLVAPVQLLPQSVLVHPYLLGLLLGDGGMSKDYSLTLTTADEFIRAEALRLLPRGMAMKPAGKYSWHLVSADERGKRSNPLIQSMGVLGLMGVRSHQKHVPQCYLWNTPGVRLALLQGLLDTDGTILRHSNSVSYSTTAEQLADDVTSWSSPWGVRRSSEPDRPTTTTRASTEQGD
jgi:phosphate starvation-inducible PhoH-like protein